MLSFYGEECLLLNSCTLPPALHMNRQWQVLPPLKPADVAVFAARGG